MYIVGERMNLQTKMVLDWLKSEDKIDKEIQSLVEERDNSLNYIQDDIKQWLDNYYNKENLWIVIKNEVNYREIALYYITKMNVETRIKKGDIFGLLDMVDKDELNKMAKEKGWDKE